MPAEDVRAGDLAAMISKADFHWPWPTGGRGSPAHAWGSQPLGFCTGASLPCLEQLSRFPIPLCPPGSHQEVTTFEKASTKLPWYHVNARALALTTVCSRWFAWTLHRPQVPHRIWQNRYMREGAACAKAASFAGRWFCFAVWLLLIDVLEFEGHKRNFSVYLFRTEQGELY